jgi:hypothetical protein
VDHPADDIDDIDDFGDGWRILVVYDDDCAGLDERLVTRVTQEGPHMTGLVLNTPAVLPLSTKSRTRPTAVRVQPGPHPG